MYYKILRMTAVFVCLFVLLTKIGTVSAASKIDKSAHTESFYVSMLFHKLAGTKPNFGLWAEMTDLYKEAGDFDKLAIRNDQEEFFENFFEVLDTKEQVKIEFKTKISAYSYTNSGFFIDSFQPDLFFNFEHMGEFFAVIPDDIDNYQWFSVPASDIIETGLNIQDENEVILRIMLEARYADAEKPALLGKDKFWMLLTEVKDIELWSADGEQLLWRAEKAKDNSLLLNLYQR